MSTWFDQFDFDHAQAHVLFERVGDKVYAGTPEARHAMLFSNAPVESFNALCARAKEILGRELTEYECIMIQALLGTQNTFSPAKLVIGPGAQIFWERRG